MARFANLFDQAPSSLFRTAKTSITRLNKTTSSSALSSVGSSFLSALKTVAQQTVTPSQVASILKDIPKTAVVSKKEEVKFAVPNLIQGKNECGSTSLAMVMKFWKIDPGNYHKMFPSYTFGLSPTSLRAKAQEKGLTVRQHNGATLEEMAATMKAIGGPVMVLGINGGGANSSSITDYVQHFAQTAPKAHWMVAVGYKRDDNGNITHVYVNDPNKSSTVQMPAADFMKFWNNNIIPGGHRYYMAMAPKGSFAEKMLKKQLPSDKISDTFAAALKAVDALQTAAYNGEKVVNATGALVDKVVDKVVDTAKDVGNAVASAAEDAYDEISSWLS